jgi:hypothetical protein
MVPHRVVLRDAEPGQEEEERVLQEILAASRTLLEGREAASAP